MWFESDANVVTLEKQFDSASGAIYYIGQNLTIDDYVPGQMYDLHTQGEEGGIGEYILEDVQPTVLRIGLGLVLICVVSSTLVKRSSRCYGRRQ